MEEAQLTYHMVRGLPQSARAFSMKGDSAVAVFPAMRLTKSFSLWQALTKRCSSWQSLPAPKCRQVAAFPIPKLWS